MMEQFKCNLGFYAILTCLLISTLVSAQSFSERHITVEQTEYDMFKRSSLDVSCQDFFCDKPDFVLTESLRPFINDTIITYYEKADYVNFCDSLKAALASKELVDWQYAYFEKEALDFEKLDCKADWQILKDRFDKEVFVVPNLTSDKIIMEKYPKEPIVNLRSYTKTYIPNIIEWSGKLTLTDYKTTLKIGEYTNSYNIIVNFSNNLGVCYSNITDYLNLNGASIPDKYNCAILLNKNGSFTSTQINISGLILGNPDIRYYNRPYNYYLTASNTYGALGEAYSSVKTPVLNSSYLYHPLYNTKTDRLEMQLIKNGVPEIFNCNFNISYCNISCSNASGVFTTGGNCIMPRDYLGTYNFTQLNNSFIYVSDAGGGPYEIYSLGINKNISLSRNECYQIMLNSWGVCNNSDSTVDNFVMSGYYPTSPMINGMRSYGLNYNYFSTSAPQISSISYNISTSNVSLDVGADGFVDWNMSGIFDYTNSTIPSLVTALQQCATNTSLCSNDFCTCPLRVTSNSGGIIKFSGLNVTYNTPPIAINVSISNAPISAGENASGVCDCWDYDSLVQDTFIENYTWYVNSTQKDYNVTTLQSGNYTTGNNLIFSCQCSDSYAWSSWTNSSVVTVGDNIAPTNSTVPTISDTAPCNTGTSTLTANITDASSNVNLVYAETTLPSGKTNLTMTCVGSNLKNQQCTYAYTSYTTPITIHQLWVSDSSNNWGTVNVTRNINFYTCGGGGGGGGALTTNFEILPRALTNLGEVPEPANIIGDVRKEYSIHKKTGGVLTLTLQFANATTSADGKMIDATPFFKTIPEDSIVVDQDYGNLTVYCDIPDDYRYQPWGRFNSTLIVGGSSTEKITVVCESAEHAGQAGALNIFLGQDILPGLSVGLFLLILVGLAVFVAWLM